MNIYFKVLFSHALGGFVAVSELAKGKGKLSTRSIMAKTRYSYLKLKVMTATLLAALGLVLHSAWANDLVGNGKGSANQLSAPACFQQESTQRIVCGASTVKDGAINGIAFGTASQAMEENAIAQGHNSVANGKNSIAIGTGANVATTPDWASSLAIGEGAKVTGSNAGGSIAIGYHSNSVQQGTAVGRETNAAVGSVAVGDQVKTTGTQAVGIGNQVKAQGDSSIAIGGDSLDDVDKEVKKKYADLTGKEIIDRRYIDTKSGGDASVVVGVQAQAIGALSTAFGTRTITEGLASTALGMESKAKEDTSVAIGSLSVAGRAAFKSEPTVNSRTTVDVTKQVYGLEGDDAEAIKKTAQKTLGAVSVGNATYNRQITNVAAGSADSDAVNVSQLRAVANKIDGLASGNISWNIQGNHEHKGTVANNQTVDFIDGEGTTAVVDSGNGTYKVKVNVNKAELITDDTGKVSVTPNTGNGDRFATASNVAEAINATRIATINAVKGDIINTDKKASAGVASAMAASGLPQAYLPGKSMVAISGGVHRGENALAIGVSRISDSGHIIIKLNGATNSKGDTSGSIGVGYQW